ncbi:MAG: hypothetical protein EPO11_10040 [Gammaproteobacteria bacterium]|nr:MAG: hypothetical protein EPO11_10040 [Gammaproteobacteria bacterium]
MTKLKMTLSVSEELVKEINAITPNFSEVVEAALIKYLRSNIKVKTFKEMQGFVKIKIHGDVNETVL